jgi:hypothetical protein
MMSLANLGPTRKPSAALRRAAKFALKCNLNFPFFQSPFEKEWQG